jgi:hypothetical protein
MNKKIVYDIIFIHETLHEAAKKSANDFFSVDDLKEKIKSILEKKDKEILKDLSTIAVVLKSISSILIYEPVNAAIQMLWRLKSLSRMIANPERINLKTFRMRLQELCDYINDVDFHENNSKLALYHKP